MSMPSDIDSYTDALLELLNEAAKDLSLADYLQLLSNLQERIESERVDLLGTTEQLKN